MDLNNIMAGIQDLYDDAMFDFSKANYDSAIEKLKSALKKDATYFDAQHSLGMAYYRKGDYLQAIAQGHKAEAMRPNEQPVHTNLSLFYMKAGDISRGARDLHKARDLYEEAGNAAGVEDVNRYLGETGP